MSKIDFSNIVIKDIEGHDVQADIQNQLGNKLYMQGQNIEWCELGKKIYFANGEVELSKQESDIIRAATAGYSYIVRQAVEEKLK